MQVQNFATIQSENLLRDAAEQVPGGLLGRGREAKSQGVLRAKSLGKTAASWDFHRVLKPANYLDG